MKHAINMVLTEHMEAYESLKGQDFISINDFSIDDILSVISLAKEIKVAKKDKNYWYYNRILEGKILLSAFLEGSTRTRLSFESAMMQLGGRVLDFKSKESSLKKGESIEDTFKCVGYCCDVIILRSDDPKYVYDVAKATEIPVINAGNGDMEHPTQALKDLFAIQEFKGDLNLTDYTSTFIGDMRYSRTVHSLVYPLVKLGCNIVLIAPQQLRMNQSDIKNFGGHVEEVTIELDEHRQSILEQKNVIEAIKKSNILYATRIQKERFTKESLFSDEELEIFEDMYQIDNQILIHNPKIGLMHPLPRVKGRARELLAELDETKNALYFKPQAEGGLYTAMALLTFICFDP